MAAVGQISVEDLHSLLTLGDESLVVLDVRQKWELEVASLPQAIHIPLGELPEKAEELPKEKPIYVLCHHGGRSLQAAFYLAQFGYENVFNIQGGIHDWALKIDNSIQTY